MNLIHLNMDNFKEFINSKDMVLIDFWATWCGPCKMLAPVLEELVEKEIINVGKVDVDEYSELAEAFDIQSIPTLMIFKEGKLIAKRMGYQPFNIIKEWVLQYK